METAVLDIFTSQRKNRAWKKSYEDSSLLQRLRKSSEAANQGSTWLDSVGSPKNLDKSQSHPQGIDRYMKRSSQIMRKIEEKYGNKNCEQTASTWGRNHKWAHEKITEANDEEDNKSEKCVGTSMKYLQVQNNRPPIRIISPEGSRVVVGPDNETIIFPPQIVNVRPFSAPKPAHTCNPHQQVLLTQAHQGGSRVVINQPMSPGRIVINEPIVRRVQGQPPVPQAQFVIPNAPQRQVYIQQVYGQPQPCVSYNMVPQVPQQQFLQRGAPHHMSLENLRPQSHPGLIHQYQPQPVAVIPQISIEQCQKLLTQKLSMLTVQNQELLRHISQLSEQQKKQQITPEMLSSIRNLLTQTQDRNVVNVVNQKNVTLVNKTYESSTINTQRVQNQHKLQVQQPAPSAVYASLKKVSSTAMRRPAQYNTKVTSETFKTTMKCEIDKLDDFDENLQIDCHVSELNNIKLENVNDGRKYIREMDEILQKYGKKPEPVPQRQLKDVKNQQNMNESIIDRVKNFSRILSGSPEQLVESKYESAPTKKYNYTIMEQVQATPMENTGSDFMKLTKNFFNNLIQNVTN